MTVRLSEPTSRDVTFAYTTADGTAQAGRDYTARSGTVTIPRGRTDGKINVKVRGDADTESTEIFSVAISAPTKATIARARATVRILDDDPAPAP